jgi:hypothetical protein
MGTKQTKKKPKRRGRPPLDKTLNTEFKLRLSGDDRELFNRAATSVGARRGGRPLPLAAWMRETLTAAARAELGDDAVE